MAAAADLPGAAAPGAERMKRHHKLLLLGIVLFVLAWLSWTMLTVEADLAP